MTGDALIAEGHRLARPCVHLKPDGDPSKLAAIWRGPGTIPAPDGDFEHWLTIDCRFLPSGVGPAAGCMSVYTDNDRYGAVGHDATASLALTHGAKALYAYPTSSLPPLEAVFLFGSPAVHEWLSQLGWKPDWGWNGNFRDQKVANAYIEAQRVNMPVDGNEVFGVLGGWHVPWPDGDWPELVDHPLVVLTLAESEPWVEVFNMSGEFKVIQRIS